LTGSLAGTLIVSVQAVVLIPLYIHYVGPKLYGAWLGSGDILVWLQTLDLGLPNLMIQRIGAAHSRGDRDTVGAWLASGTLVLGIVSVLILGAGLAVAPALPSLMHVAGEEGRRLSACFSAAAAAASVVLFTSAFVGFSRGILATAAMNGLQVASAAVGFAVSLVLVIGGQGLWSIPLGMAARAAVGLIGSLLIVRYHVKRGEAGAPALRASIVREFTAVSPATGSGGLAYVLMNHSETAIVAMVVGPAAAAAYGVTRKAADLGRTLLDTIGAASYGSFAHLVGASSGARALEVHREISSVRTGAAVVFAAIYASVNASLVSVWVGPGQFAGTWVTNLVALQVIVVGGSYLVNYLYRATGQVVRGSWALVAEAACRVPLMVALVGWFGSAGVPAAGIATGLVSGLVVWRWTLRAVGVSEGERGSESALAWIGRIAVVAAGMIAGARAPIHGWWYVTLVAGAAAAIASVGVLATDWRLRSAVANVMATVLRGRAAGAR
jgi:O-antigen/teichoic acid export membrane protein